MTQRQDVSNFISSTFRSVWSLELLLHLKQGRERSWPHAEMVTALRGSDLVVTQSVASLLAAGLVVADDDGAARYQPVSKDLDRLVELAEAYYARSPDAVRRLIATATNPSIAAFADSFRLRRD